MGNPLRGGVKPPNPTPNPLGSAIAMVAAVSSQVHIQTASFACSTAEITNKE